MWLVDHLAEGALPVTANRTVPVLIGTALEAEQVARIAAVDPVVEVLYAPELLPPARFAADHEGPPRDLSGPDLDRWRSLRARAEVSFDFDWLDPAGVAANCPRLRWVQATSSGIGQFIEQAGLGASGITFTTAAGVHALPLAEFALAGVLYFVKELPELARRQAARSWERYTARQLAGKRVTIVGLGQIGRKTCEVFTALGAQVTGVARVADAPGVVAARVIAVDALDSVLPASDVIVLCCPLTAQTRGLLSGRRLRMLPPGAIVVNVARGPVIDEPALIEALADGHLGGAFLDVATVEPLPAGSALWELPNVVISPHSASTVDAENALLTDLFCDNLRRWLDGAPLRNRYSREKGY
jgi:glyoxylate/hydroxypyruvate reductase